jgi:hypothetical protein
MINSHEVINLETMAQCLADARTLLRDGDMCADTYVSLLEEAARLLRSVLTFAQDVGLEIDDEEQTEAWAIVDRYQAVLTHRRSTTFQGGDLDLYLDLQSLGDTLVLESRSGDGDGPVKGLVSVYELSFADCDPESNFGVLKAKCDEWDRIRNLEKSRDWSYALSFPDSESLPGFIFRNFCKHNHDDVTELSVKEAQLKAWLAQKGAA